MRFVIVGAVLKWIVARWKRAEQAAKYWRTVPPGGLLLLLVGISCLFAAFGLMITLINVAAAGVGYALLMALNAGLFAAALAFTGFRFQIRWTIAILVVDFASTLLLTTMLGRHALPLEASAHAFRIIQYRNRIEATLAVILIITGYSLMVSFMRKEGLRVIGVMTEVRLASEIHRALVPVISTRSGPFEMYGASTASGEMGGDLVDLIDEGNRWTAYVADVSGHGVSAGMIMSMVKSGTRMGSFSGDSMPATLSHLNRVIASLSTSNVFVTFACISGNHGPRLDFSLAGHLPILHCSKRLKTVEEKTVSNLPLGVLPDSTFQTASLDCEPGDLLAILTDGFTEVANREEQELGLEPFKAALLENLETSSLEETMRRLRQKAVNYGKQRDDQTLLLIRYMG